MTGADDATPDAAVPDEATPDDAAFDSAPPGPADAIVDGSVAVKSGGRLRAVRRRLGRLFRAVALVAVTVAVVGALAGGGVLVGFGLADGQRTAAGDAPASPVPPSLAPAASVGPSVAPVGPTAVLVGAGDIADCPPTHAEQTAALVNDIAALVFTTGDNAYPTGSTAQFDECYGPSWGFFRGRTYPAIGNHDALTANGAPYYAYFGEAAGTPPDGWYSYDAATWHVIVLNSNCRSVGGCGDGSREMAWLKADLAAHPAVCTLAIWHHPRFSSGEHGNNKVSDPFWQVLYEAHADLIVNGHDHDYERFAPQTPTGEADPVNGIREIVVGTGGKSLRLFNKVVPNSEVRSSTTYGVLRLDLAPGRYSWQFIGTESRSFGDSGTTACH